MHGSQTLKTMISLELEQIYLLELIKVSLFGITPKIPENANWEKIFDAAKTQCVVPLLSSYVPSEYSDQWNAIAYQSKAHYMQMLYEQNLLVKLFENNNIPFVILKGTTAAIYYPNPLLRTFGDVDVYVSNKYWNTAVDLLNENKYVCFSKDDRTYEYEKNGIGFDFHTRFSCRYYNDIDHLILNGMTNAVEYQIFNNKFPGLPNYENGLVLLGHIMQHLNDSGIGLRQIIDWMMFVHNNLDDSSWNNYFKPLAAEAGLEKLAIIVTAMCKKWLGLPDKITWCNNSNDDLLDQLLARILVDGNFGQDRAPVENIRKALKNEGFFKYLQRAGMLNWTLAQKYVVFRPFAWLYQICRFACSGFLRIISGKKVFKQDKKNMRLEELLDKLS